MLLEPQTEKPSPAMTEARAEAILARIEGHIAAGTNPMVIAIDAGIDRAALDALLRRQSQSARPYQPAAPYWAVQNDADALQGLEGWADNEDAEPGRPELADTPTRTTIRRLLSNAHRSRKLIAITGDVGIGKSKEAEAYVRENARGHKKPGAVLIEFDKTVKNEIDVLLCIMAALGGGEGSRSRPHLLNAVGAALQPGDFLILDECNRLTDKGDGIDVVRDIHGRFRVGVAMIGNPSFSKAVWSAKGSAFEALASRTMRHDLGSTKEDDVLAWMAWEGLSGAQWRELCVKVGARPGRNGGLRTLSLALESARQLAEALGTAPTVKMMRDVLQSFGRAL